MSWLPLESNPDVMNMILENVGVPAIHQIVDVYGIDPDLLATVPQPVLAVILLFPTTPKLEEFGREEEEKMKTSGDGVSKNITFVKQFVRNACGTVALVHSVINNLDRIKLKEDGVLNKFVNDIKDKTPDEAGNVLAVSDIGKVHDLLAEQGQTEAPAPDSSVNFHFVAFVEKDGDLYELDGRKSTPIKHSATTKDSLLQDAVKVIRRFMEADPDNIQFTMVALVTVED